MPDRRFFSPRGPFAVVELAAIGGATLGDGAPADRRIVDVASLGEADGETISFLDNNRYVEAFRSCRAAACVVRPEHAGEAPPGMALLLSDNPYRTYALIAQAFYPDEPDVMPVWAPDAAVDPSARIGEGVAIAPGAVIGAGVEIGARSRIGANAVIGRSVVIGEDCVVGALSSLAYCLLGNRVRLAAGVRIGEEGFGFAPDAAGHVKVPQLGRVVIHDDVEIGANSTVDRGAGPDTVIGPGCRIDNLVQIGHNVKLGRGCIIVAQSGISGSTQLDDFAVIAAQGGVAGHLRIGKGARVAAKSGVMRDVADGVTVAGIPAVPIKQFFRQVALAARLARSKGD